jgi:SAM-dependent methyltransferase
VADALADARLLRRFARGRSLPRRYGVGYDERVVEYPWALASEPRGRTLDAGSSLNHAHVLDAFLPRLDSLTIATLSPERDTFEERGLSYVYADLRRLPFEEAAFDTVISISTLEHVGMDNSRYGAPGGRSPDPDRELHLALEELRRVLAPGGRLLASVPYGRREDHGWFRQLDREGVERLVEAFGGPERRLSVFAYGGRGWRRSDPRAAAEARYHEHAPGARPPPDRAAAARAVACLELRR